MAIIIIIAAVSVPRARLTKFYLIFTNTLIYTQQHAHFLQEDSPNTAQLGSGKIESQTQACLITKFWLLRTSALGQPRGMAWGGRREEGSGWGTHVYLWRIHFDIWQN